CSGQSEVEGRNIYAWYAWDGDGGVEGDHLHLIDGNGQLSRTIVVFTWYKGGKQHAGGIKSEVQYTLATVKDNAGKITDAGVPSKELDLATELADLIQ